jgi:hypothetical protein
MAMGDASDTGLPDVHADSPADSPADHAADAPADHAADAQGDAPADAPADTKADVVDSGMDASDATLSPIANFPTTTIDLGLGNCGGAALTGTLTFMNSGTAPLIVTGTTTGTVYSVTGSPLTVAPGQSGSLTVKAVVAAGSTAGTALTGSLAITTNDTGHATATIPLTVKAQGATLAWAATSPTKADFGVAPNNVADTPIALTLTNTGNAAASVAFGAPSNAQFSLTVVQDGGGASASIAAGGSAMLTAGFMPNTLTASTATSTFAVTGAVCGTSVTSLSFSGQGGVSTVTGWPTSALDFGLNPCGGAAPNNQIFTLANSGSIVAHIVSSTFAGVAGYQTDATAGKAIPAGGSLQVQIGAPAIPATSAVPGDYAGTLTITTDVAGDSPHVIQLTESAHGAILAFDTTPTNNFGAFGNQPVGSAANQNFNIVNSGNAPAANVVVATTTPFSVATANFASLAVGSQPDTASFTPSTFGAATGSLSMSASGLCQPAPAAIPFTGTGQSGGIAISTQGLGFVTACGTTAPTQTFTITNSGNQPMTWNATITGGTWYQMAIAPAVPGSMIGPITLAAGGSSTVTVYPVAMPQSPATNAPAAFADLIAITTDIPADTTHNVALSESPLGDWIAWVPSAIPFGSIPINQVAAAQAVLLDNGANPGSPTANLTITSNDPTDFPVSVGSLMLAPDNGQGTFGVTFHAPATPGALSSTITITTNDVLCHPLPVGGGSNNIAVSGTATQAGPFPSTNALNFGLNNCGGMAAAPQTVTMSNTGSQDFTVTGLLIDNASYFSASMSPPSGLAPAGGAPVTITVTPNAIPFPVPAAPAMATYSGTLTIQTNANVAQPNFPVTLTMGAKGVIVSNTLPAALTTWDFGPIPNGSQGNFSVQITNAGNAPLQVALDGLTSTVFALAPPTTEAVAPGSLAITSTFTPNAPHTTWTDTGTLSVTPTTGNTLCQALPTSWTNPLITLKGNAP